MNVRLKINSCLDLMLFNYLVYNLFVCFYVHIVDISNGSSHWQNYGYDVGQIKAQNVKESWNWRVSPDNPWIHVSLFLSTSIIDDFDQKLLVMSANRTTSVSFFKTITFPWTLLNHLSVLFYQQCSINKSLFKWQNTGSCVFWLLLHG